LSEEPHRVILFAFDLLHLVGKDMRNEPLVERRVNLKALLAGADPALQFSEAVEGEGRKVFVAAQALGVEI
jgi:bifunctional non-homologous end joining protein LigD